MPERIAQIEHLYRELLAQEEARHKTQVEELSAHYKAQIEELKAHLERTTELLCDKSVRLAESETREDELRKRLRLQLKAAERLCGFLDDVNDAAARLRSSARWQIANPVAAVKAKVSRQKARELLGYGHLEKIVSAYEKWRTTHPEVAAIDNQIQALISGAACVAEQRLAPVEPLMPTRPIEFPVHEEVEI